jgi:single-strand DNA-binding protein
MSGVNKVLIIGRLGIDPEVKTLSSGQQVATFSVATSENWNDRDGQKQERTEWHRIVVWGKLAELCGKYLTKGRQVYLEGRLQTRSWDDKNGQKRYTTEIVAQNVQFLGSQNNPSHGHAGAAAGASAVEDFGPEPAFDNNSAADEIPF